MSVGVGAVVWSHNVIVRARYTGAAAPGVDEEILVCEWAAVVDDADHDALARQLLALWVALAGIPMSRIDFSSVGRCWLASEIPDDDAGLQNVGETLLDGDRHLASATDRPASTCSRARQMIEEDWRRAQEPGWNDPDAEELDIEPMRDEVRIERSDFPLADPQQDRQRKRALDVLLSLQISPVRHHASCCQVAILQDSQDKLDGRTVTCLSARR